MRCAYPGYDPAWRSAPKPAMSYDVFIELPKALRKKPKRGEYPPEALARLEQIVASLQRIDPEIVIERDDALVEGSSQVLGQVVADPNRISLRYSSAFGYHGMLQAMQRALGELEPLGFEGHDPQIGARIHYFAERAAFMRQFRSQILARTMSSRSGSKGASRPPGSGGAS